MTTWSSARQLVREAPRVVTLQPSCFADEWHHKPQEPIQCGLRLISEGDVEQARIAALEWVHKTLTEATPDIRVEAYNDAIMRMVLARAMCMPHDVREAFFSLPEENVREALTEDGVKLLWHEYDLLKTEMCTYLAEADEDDLTELSMMLLDQEAWAKLSTAKFKRLRRIAMHFLEELDPELRF